MCGQPCCIAAPDAHGPRSFPEFHRAVSSVLSGGSLMWWCHLLPPYSCSYPKPPTHQSSAPDTHTHAHTHTHTHTHVFLFVVWLIEVLVNYSAVWCQQKDRRI